MSISLDTFQRTLDASNLQGFVKLSNGGNAVTSYGGGFFARHFGLYTKPSVEENNAVRRMFYQSIVDTLNCQGQVLADLRQELGIADDGTSASGRQLGVNEARNILRHVKTAMAELSANAKERQDVLDGLDKGGFLEGAIRHQVMARLGIGNPAVAETKLDNMTAREIRNFAMDATANRTVRNDLFAQLEKDRLCQGEIGAQVRAMLRLDDEDGVLQPLSPSERKAILAHAKDASAALHASRLAEQKLPAAEALDKLVAPEDLASCKAILDNPAASQKDINHVVRAINSFSMKRAHENWSAQVDDALAQLSRDLAIDCSALKDGVLQRIVDGLHCRYDSDSQLLAVVSAEQLQSSFTEALSRTVNDRKAMSDCLTKAMPRLAPAVASYLRAELATNAEFRKPAEMQVLVDHADAGRPLLNLFHAENVSEADYLDAYAAAGRNVQAALASFHDAGGDVCDTPVTTRLGKMLFQAGKAALESERGQPLPVRDDIRAMAVKHTRLVNFVCDEIDDNPETDFRADDDTRNIVLEFESMQIYAFMRDCGIPLDPAELCTKLTAEEKTLSPAFEKRFADLGVSRARHDLVGGKPFDVTLRSAFKKALTESLADELQRADKAMRQMPANDELPHVLDKTFVQTYKDLTRNGTGLRIGDTVVASDGESYAEKDRSAAIAKMSAKINAFFMEDSVNGLHAARILSGLVQQGFAANMAIAFRQSKEPFGALFRRNADHAMDFFLDRAKDGSYGLHYSGTFCYLELEDEGTSLSLDPSRSRIRFDVDLKLSFPPQTREPTLSVVGNPTVSGRLTPLGFDEIDLEALRVPEDGTDLAAAAITSGAFNDPAVKRAYLKDRDLTATANLLRDKVFLRQDTELLSLFGLSNADIKRMVLGLAGDDGGPRLGKEIIGRLKDPSTRNAAIRNLTSLMEPYVRAGFIPSAPAMQPEILNLVSVAGLSSVTFKDGMSDMRLAADFIAQSKDPAVKQLPANLQSSDPSVVAAAKDRVQQIVHEQRSRLGLSILESHINGFNAEAVRKLQRNIPAAQLNKLLPHVIDRDDDFDDAIRAFKTLLESAEIIEAGRRRALKAP